MKEHLFNRTHVIARVLWETVITAVASWPRMLLRVSSLCYRLQ
jgi:hypothetical protein